MTAALILLALAAWPALFAAVLASEARHAPRHLATPAGAGGVRQPGLRLQSSTRSRGGGPSAAKIGTGANLQEKA